MITPKYARDRAKFSRIASKRTLRNILLPKDLSSVLNRIFLKLDSGTLPTRHHGSMRSTVIEVFSVQSLQSSHCDVLNKDIEEYLLFIGELLEELGYSAKIEGKHPKKPNFTCGYRLVIDIGD